MIRYSRPIATHGEMPDPITEIFPTADAALERIEQLAMERAADLTLWKRLDFKLRAQAKLSTRLRAAKTAPATSPGGSVVPPATDSRPAAGGNAPLDETLRATSQPIHPALSPERETFLRELDRIAPIVAANPPAPWPCEAIGCQELGTEEYRFVPKSPFISKDDPILLAHFCRLHIGNSTLILWEFHRDHLDCAGSAALVPRVDGVP
jgi:hypothetical protein